MKTVVEFSAKEQREDKQEEHVEFPHAFSEEEISAIYGKRVRYIQTNERQFKNGK